MAVQIVYDSTETDWGYSDLAMIAGQAAHTLDGLLVGAGCNMKSLEDLLEYISQRVSGDEPETSVNRILAATFDLSSQDIGSSAFLLKQRRLLEGLRAVADNPDNSKGGRDPDKVRELREMCARIALAAKGIKLPAPSPA